MAWLAVGTGAAQARPGDLDGSFGAGGVVKTGTEQGSVTDFVVAPDDKVLATEPGNAREPFPTIKVVRLNANGSPDAGFGSGGVATVALPGVEAYPRAVALQPDGKVVIAGSVIDGPVTPNQTRVGPCCPKNTDLLLARLNPDGSLDPTFGAGGTVRTSFSSYDEVGDVAVLADGRILVDVTSSYDAALNTPPPIVTEHGTLLARFSSSGQPDTTFGTGGTSSIAESTNNRAAGRLTVQPNGRVLVSEGDSSLRRYLPDGTQDSSFGPGGQGISADSEAEILLRPDGRLVVLTASGLAQYRPDGALDPTFHRQSVATSAGTSPSARLALQPDGRVLVAPIFGVPLVLERFNVDGTPDLRFGPGGREGPAVDYTSAFAGLAFQRGGRIIAAGGSTSGQRITAFVNGDRCASRATSKLTIASARVTGRSLEVMAPISTVAHGRVRVTYRASGHAVHFTAAIAGRRIRVRHRLSEALRRGRTGIVTVFYPGDAHVRGRTVRARAATGAVGLTVTRPTLIGSRLKASGKVSRHARGIVRVTLDFSDAGCTPVAMTVRARIHHGRWSLSHKLNAAQLAQLATREGAVQTYMTYTGSAAHHVRGASVTRQLLHDR